MKHSNGSTGTCSSKPETVWVGFFTSKIESESKQQDMKLVLLGLLLTGAIAVWQFDLLVEVYIDGAEWLLRNVIF
jgi:hypothetical protein